MENLIMMVEKAEDLIDFVSRFDADLSGANGIEYTSQEAIDNGFESDIEYLVSANVKACGNDLKKVVMGVMADVLGTYEGYGDADFSTLTVNEGIVVSFSYSV